MERYKKLLMVILVITTFGCSNDPDIKVSLASYKTGEQEVYQVGDTLYYEYMRGTPVMFIIKKIDAEQKVFIGLRNNIFNFSNQEEDILPFREYLAKRYNK